MWIVRLALNRPYTFVVLALLLFLIAPVMLLRTPVDIFPEINIPVVSIIWTYTGLVPREMEIGTGSRQNRLHIRWRLNHRLHRLPGRKQWIGMRWTLALHCRQADSGYDGHLFELHAFPSSRQNGSAVRGTTGRRDRRIPLEKVCSVPK
jgi:hypothetical protein